MRVHLLERRYRHLGLVARSAPASMPRKGLRKGAPASGSAERLQAAAPGDAQWPRFCSVPAVLEQVIAKGDWGLEILRSTLRDVAWHLGYIRQLGGTDRFVIFLLNFLEVSFFFSFFPSFLASFIGALTRACLANQVSVQQAVGTRAVHQFLWDFVHC